MEKVRLDRIRRLLEITKRESNLELLLSAKNLQELGASPFPYIVFVIPRLLLDELVKGEHIILADLLKSIPGSSSQARSDQEKLGSFKEPRLPLSDSINYLWPYKTQNLPPKRQRRRREKRE